MPLQQRDPRLQGTPLQARYRGHLGAFFVNCGGGVEPPCHMRKSTYQPLIQLGKKITVKNHQPVMITGWFGGDLQDFDAFLVLPQSDCFSFFAVSKFNLCHVYYQAAWKGKTIWKIFEVENIRPSFWPTILFVSFFHVTTILSLFFFAM